MTDRIDTAFAALDQLESPLSWDDVTTSDLDDRPHSALIETEPRRPRRPPWQALAAATIVLVLLAGGVWFATKSSDSSSNDRATAGHEIAVGAVTVVIPDGMELDGSVATVGTAGRVRARLSTAVGTCTITSSSSDELHRWTRARNSMEVERFNASLQGYAQLRYNLETRIAALNQQISALPPGSDEAPSLASQRIAALQQIDQVNQQMSALSQAGPNRPPAGEGFTPADDGRTTWRAQATPSDVVDVTCPDPATAQQLVDATTLPHA